jgi:hypothetical protein
MVAQKSLNGKGDHNKNLAAAPSLNFHKTGGRALNAGGPKIQL